MCGDIYGSVNFDINVAIRISMHFIYIFVQLIYLLLLFVCLLLLHLYVCVIGFVVRFIKKVTEVLKCNI